MPVVVKGKNIEVPGSLRQYILRKAARLDRFFYQVDAVRAEVAVGHSRGQYDAEVTMQMGGVFLRGVGRAPEAQAAVDEAVDRAERQFIKFKSRIQTRLQTSPKMSTVVTDETGRAEAVEGDTLPRVVRVKRFALKPMSVDEAVMQMELLGHDFFVFTNAATDETNVLYRRKDGDYGLIEPQP